MLVDVISHNNIYGGLTPPAQMRMWESRVGNRPHTVHILNCPAQPAWWTLFANTELVRDPNLKIPLEVGIAHCHWMDMYCRKKGREEAIKKTKLTEWYLHSVGWNDLQMVVTLKGVDDGTSFLRLSYKGNNSRPHAEVF